MGFQEIVNKYNANASQFITDVKNANVTESFLRGRRIKLGDLENVRYNDLLKACLTIISKDTPHDSAFVSKIIGLATAKAEGSWKMTQAFTWIKSRWALRFYDRNADMNKLIQKFADIVVENDTENEDEAGSSSSPSNEPSVRGSEEDSDDDWGDEIKEDELETTKPTDNTDPLNRKETDVEIENSIQNEEEDPSEDWEVEVEEPKLESKKDEQETKKPVDATRTLNLEETVFRTEDFIYRSGADSLPFTLALPRDARREEIRVEQNEVQAVSRQIVRSNNVNAPKDLDKLVSGKKVVVIEQKGEDFFWNFRSPSQLKIKDFQAKNKWVLTLEKGEIKIAGATIFPVENPKIQQIIEMKGLNLETIKAVPVAKTLKALPSTEKVEFSLEDEISLSDPKLAELFSEGEISEMQEAGLSNEDLKDAVRMRLFVLEKYNELLQKNSAMVQEILESRASASYTEQDFQSDLFQLLQEAVAIFKSGRIGVESAEIYSPKLGAGISLIASDSGEIEDIVVENVIVDALQNQEAALKKALEELKNKLSDLKENQRCFQTWKALLKEEKLLRDSIVKKSESIQKNQLVLRSLNDEKNDLEQKNEARTHKISDLEEKQKSIRKKIQQLEEERENKIASMKSFKHSESEIELERLKFQFYIDIEKKEDLFQEKMIAFNKKMRQSIVEQMASNKKKIEGTIDLLQQDQAEITRVESEISKISAEIHRLNADGTFDTLKSQPKFFWEGIAALEKEMRNVKFELKSLGAELREEPIKLIDNSEELEEQIKQKK